MYIVIQKPAATLQVTKQAVRVIRIAKFNIPNGITENAFNALGDLLVGTGINTYMTLTVGNDGEVLTADSSSPGGLKWEAIAAGGSTLTMRNNGSDVTLGDVVINDGAIDNGVKMTTRERDFRVLGVSGGSTLNGVDGPFYNSGIQDIKVTGAVKRGNWLITSTTAGRAKDSGSPSRPAEGGLGIALQENASGNALIKGLLLPQTIVGFEAGNLYVAYGLGASTYADCEQYTPDTWTSKTDGPSPARYGGGGVALGSAYYSVGGYNAGYQTDNDQYTPDTWASKTNMPAPARSSNEAATPDGTNLYSIGGYGGSYLADNDSYAVDTWSSKTDFSRAQGDVGLADLSSKLYIISGWTSVAVQNADEYTPPGTYVAKTNCPSPGRYGAALTKLGTKVYLMGGITTVSLADNDEYTPDTWTSKADAPSPARHFPSGGTLGGTLYLVYGKTAPSTYLADNDSYVVDTWTSKADAPSPARSEISGSGVI